MLNIFNGHCCLLEKRYNHKYRLTCKALRCHCFEQQHHGLRKPGTHHTFENTSNCLLLLFNPSNFHTRRRNNTFILLYFHFHTLTLLSRANINFSKFPIFHTINTLMYTYFYMCSNFYIKSHFKTLSISPIVKIEPYFVICLLSARCESRLW